MFEKRVVVDCKGHLLGRLASVIAKELLNGQHVVCLRTEEIEISGSFARNKMKYMLFLQKRMNTNPKRGPFHFRAPHKILWRTIRGMLPHKTKRGAAALNRLRLYEGVPPHFEKIQRVVVPQALRVLRLKPGRKFTHLGELSNSVGWKHYETIKKLEAKRKLRGKMFYLRKKAAVEIKQKTYEKSEVIKKLPQPSQIFV